MDNYDVVIERTVRDLFRSSQLNQIKKLKNNKDKEISNKDEELRDLILNKYPILIKSVISLEKISSSLNDLQDIRKDFGVNISKIENNMENKNVYEFDKMLFDDSDEGNLAEVDFEDKMRDDIEIAWGYLSNNNDYGSKNYNALLMVLINIEKQISNSANMISDCFIMENFYFLIVEFMESLMNDFVASKLWKYENKDFCIVKLGNTLLIQSTKLK